jgi:hypothetical protein
LRQEQRLPLFITSLLLFNMFAAWGQHHKPCPDATIRYIYWSINVSLLTRRSHTKTLLQSLARHRKVTSSFVIMIPCVFNLWPRDFLLNFSTPCI